MFMRQRFFRGCLSVIIVALTFTASVFGADNYNNWNFTAKIYLNTTTSGANITSTITGFPLLVRLNQANFPFSQALAGGADVRFSNAAGMHLPYQIERWVNNSTAEIWVKVDQILGNNASQYIYMYWGNSSSSDSSKGSAVFDTGNGFKGVWHMGENAAPILDATIDGYNGAKGGNMAQTAGAIGNAQAFNGSADYADMGKVLNPGTSSFTVSAWVKRGATGIISTIMAKSNGNNPSATYGWVFTFDVGNFLHTYVASGGAAWGDSATFHVVSSNALTDLTSWHHVAAIIDKSGNANCRLFIDGVDQTGAASGNITGVGAITDTLHFRLATQSNSADYFNGAMDEAVVSFRARSADWIKLSYQNQRPNQTMVTVAENYSLWSNSTQFTINTTAAGAGIPAGSIITNFPLLLRLTTTNFTGFSQTLSGGADVRFAKANGMPLNFQIERWVNNSVAEIWVKVDTIFGNNASQYITMYWGKTGETSMSNGPAVFDTGNGFVGTWHLGETGNSNADGYADATANAANAQGTNFSAGNETAATIGLGQSFAAASSRYITVKSSAEPKFEITGAITVSAWINVASWTVAWQAILTKGDGAWRLARSNTNGYLNLSCNGLTTNSSIEGTTVLATGTPYLATGVYDGGHLYLYINGKSDASALAATGPISTTTSAVMIGENSQQTGRYFNGVLDEPRVENTARSADWINLCYQNQKPGSSVVCSGSAPVITVQPFHDSVYTGDTATFSVTATGTGIAYQWQRSNDNGATWNNVTAGVGGTSAAYKFQSNITVDSNAQFRCVLAQCGVTISNVAKLSICSKTVITKQPTASTTSAKVGDSVTFTINATGTALSYQWQRLVSGGSWTSITGQTTPNGGIRVTNADTSNQYRCVVTGAVACGSSIVTSSAVTLSICLPPVITKPPVFQSVNAGLNAFFQVTATGANLTYQWQRNSVNITGATSTSYSFVTTAPDTGSVSPDSGAQFRCIVTNSCGSTTSASAILNVCFAPAITKLDTLVSTTVGQIAIFNIKAVGTNLTYQWQRMSSGGAWGPIAGAVSPACTLSNTAFADSNSRFNCIVSGLCGQITSNTALLKVYPKSTASFTMKISGKIDSIGPAPDTIQVIDGSSGLSIITRTWSFGDGTSSIIDSAARTETHVYSTTGIYNVKLVVKGPGGNDSMSRTVYVYPKNGNPMMMTGQYLGQSGNLSTVRLEFKNFGMLIAPPAGAPTVDSIRLWYLPGTQPPDSIHKVFLKEYQLSKFNGGSVFDDTVNVNMQNTAFQTCGFNTQILWNSGQTTPFNPFNGCMVTMRDTLRPVNSLVVSGTYTDRNPWDTVTFYIDKAQTIDSSADSVGLWYGISPDTNPDFNRNNPDVQWWPADSVRNAVPRFTYVKVSNQFNIDAAKLFCYVEILGKNKLTSATLSKYTIPIGHIRPANPIHLYAAADTGASSVINLTWNQIPAADSVDTIRFYYRSGSPIPTGQYDYNALNLTSMEKLPKNLTDTVQQINGLNPNTRYYFIAQAHSNGMWTIVRDSSTASDSTISAKGRTIDNTIKATTVFDPTTNQFRVTWRLDSLFKPDLRIGYTYSTTGGKPDSTKIKSGVDSLTADTGSFSIPLVDSLLFGKTFYVYVWLQRKNETWAPPTDSSTDTVLIPPFSWQSVHYNFTGTGDTSYGINGQVMFITPVVSSNQQEQMSGKIRVFPDSSTNYAGFINVAGGPVKSFYFDTGYSKPIVPFQISLKVSLPSGPYTMNDVFVYRFDATIGKWCIDRTTQRDTVNGFVSVYTTLLSMPFAVLIDIDTPTVTWLHASTAPVNKDSTINDSLQVSDNVGNLIVNFQSADGGDTLITPSYVPDIVAKSNYIVHVSIPGGQVSVDNGVVARFYADDGRNRKTVDMSRQVIRPSLYSDPQVTVGMKWVPLWVTAELNNPSAKQLFNFFATDTAKSHYDNTVARLFRWHPDITNIAAPNNNRWVEYTPELDSVFDFVSGRLMWIKARNDGIAMNFGPAVTMPQSAPVVVPLFANNQFTDFALPFKYNMCVGDIIAATHDSDSLADAAIDIYYWYKDTKTGNYSTQILFGPKMAIQFQDSSQVMSASDVVFSAVNHTNRVVKLVIPPISTNMSKYASTKNTTAGAKRATVGGNGLWAVKVLPRSGDSSVLSSVYCGYTPKRSDSKIVYPVSPSFDGTGVCVYDEQTGKLCGHKMLGDITNGGCSYLLAFNNGLPTAQTLSIALERTGAIPSTMKTAVYDIQTGEIVMVGQSATATVSVPVEGNGREYRWLFVGDAHYISSGARLNASAKLALTSVYPNPVRRFAHLLYTLPFGTVSSVDFTVLDIMGRTVWHKNLKEQSIFGGRRDYVWYGTGESGRRVAAGVYVLRMAANDLKGRNVGAIDRRITVIP